MKQRRFYLLVFLSVMAAAQAAMPDAGGVKMESMPHARFQLRDVCGRRVSANVENWLITAPGANPGMLEMFRVRDRKPVPQLVPWAGEFAGKYLISAVQALRMSQDPRLESTVRDVVTQLLATQAENGYLGPFPKADQLKGNWDLWGHYHCMMGLMMWHERTGDSASLLAVRRAADLMCETYLSGSRRVIDAGWNEMNMAVIHGLGQLYRLVPEPRYLQLMKQIEQDWERAGDYLRTGLAGTEFHRTPRPRWESLPDLQGLVELWRITGQEAYRTAAINHWRSIRRWDRHVNGSFSTGELALGNPYTPGAIETCCTVAWMALSVDLLRLTGDVAVADELELATLNGAAAAQHPSGRWYTYNTPMDGVRESSAHSVVFQARAGTPDLNCCSVNGPRSWGMLSEWMVMQDAADGYWIHTYLPGRVTLPSRDDASTVTLDIETRYPVDGAIVVRVDTETTSPFPIRFRIPGWARGATIALNEEQPQPAPAGTAVPVNRQWRRGDEVRLQLPFTLRYEMGAQEALNKAALFYGPLNLAYDQHENEVDPQEIAPLNLSRLSSARIDSAAPARTLDPWVRVHVTTTSGPLTLVDFASAGSRGTSTVTWLPVENPPPPPPQPIQPRDGQVIPAGGYVFKWVGPSKLDGGLLPFRLAIFEDGETSRVVFSAEVPSNGRVLSEQELAAMQPGKTYSWILESRNAQGTNVSSPGRFTLDPSLPVPREVNDWGRAAERPITDLVLNHQWADGQTSAPAGFTLAHDAPTTGGGSSLELDGRSQRLHFTVGDFPEPDYTFQVRFKLLTMPRDRMGHVVSAWCGSSDEPMRICVENGKLYARVEAGLPSGSPGVPVQVGQWYDLVLVKQGPTFRLYLDGRLRETAAVPLWLNTRARDFALGGNPHHPSANEFLHARFAGVRFLATALTEAEVRALPERPSSE